MKRTLLKHDRFLVWKFVMNAGEKKVMKPGEVNRGLTNYGPLTLNTISIFVRGSFVTLRDGRKPYHHPAGTGGATHLEADSFRGHALQALEDDSEFHCIVPRDETPTFWERTVFKPDPSERVYAWPGRLETWLYDSKTGLYPTTPEAWYEGNGHIPSEDSVIAILDRT